MHLQHTTKQQPFGFLIGKATMKKLTLSILITASLAGCQDDATTSASGVVSDGSRASDTIGRSDESHKNGGSKGAVIGDGDMVKFEQAIELSQINGASNLSIDGKKGAVSGFADEKQVWIYEPASTLVQGATLSDYDFSKVSVDADNFPDAWINAYTINTETGKKTTVNYLIHNNFVEILGDEIYMPYADFMATEAQKYQVRTDYMESDFKHGVIFGNFITRLGGKKSKQTDAFTVTGWDIAFNGQKETAISL